MDSAKSGVDITEVRLNDKISELAKFLLKFILPLRSFTNLMLVVPKNQLDH